MPLDHRLQNLRAVVLLAGAVRVNQLRKATGRSALEMPVGGGRIVLDCWREQLVATAERLGMRRLPVRVIVDRASAMKPGVSRHGPVEMSVELDPSQLRGTGGLLSDLAKGYGDDDLILVPHASQLLFEPLAEMAGDLAQAGSDVGMVCSADGTPNGLMLIRCGCLRDINPVGFVDLNEQALPGIARDGDVRVVRYDRPTARSLRTLSGYIQTLREYHHLQVGTGRAAAAVPAPWEKTFGIVEAGTQVHETAIVHDSVVMAGARVQAHAVLVRCIVCPGAEVGRGESQIDRVVGGGLVS